MSEYFHTINGARLKLQVSGPDDAPAIIVHHGAPGLGSRSEPVRSFGPFADAYRIVTFDARGSGESEDLPPYTHAQWVADIDAIREHLGLDTIVMAGGSYGGFLAMEYTLAHPERVQALILRDTAANTDYDHLAVERARATDRVTIDEWTISRIGTGHFADNTEFERYWRGILPLYDHSYDPAATERKAQATSYHYATHNAAFGVNMPAYDLTGRLGEIQCPTLVVVGRHDWRTPVQASAAIADGIPAAELVVFEQSGHSPQLEEPEKFQAVVRDFLDRAGVRR
ncbi:MULTISPECIES: alpha/beta hydrolase [unclassified Microbacterium]|uniref:alpha/beta fold hydrolase n=1 Tax=unclassified Microbacterium TaxID=2609290 RepID=UPI00214AF380|nr:MULTISPECIES: alpha/beta hydrolase [unclassified Microbacterium]MCR2783220.1 alpha/beta hydrolase [Microbacterium sp. zg.B96]MDL5351996.1 alpha/beta hydrolase [Microbacterium sp. zg-YB36]WIM15901.1 alpha/beta hydrolase [Microbacterium sp. zg-B96]